MPRASAFALLYAMVCLGCPSACQNEGLTGPTSVSDSVAPGEAVPEWSPYLGVHGYAPQTNAQQPYLEPLFRSGAVRGIRLDMDTHGGPAFAAFAAEHGVEVLGIFQNEHLLAPDAWERLAAKMDESPTVRYWEIGNELDVFTDITVHQYLPTFLALHERARQEYPQNVLIPQAPAGAAGGADNIRAMLDGGLLALAHQGTLPVLSVHYYATTSGFLYALKREVQRLPGSTEVWVTETGVDYPDLHVAHVRTEYPRLRAHLRATRIYWYVFSECTGFSLVAGLPSQCHLQEPVPSPLYRALTGGAS